jgi:hypothetical protein
LIEMTKGKSPLHRAARFSAVAVIFACAALTPPAAAMSGDGNLSPLLIKLAKPSVRSLPLARQATALDVARGGPGSLLRRGGRVLVKVRFDTGALARLNALRGTGGQVVSASRRYQTVTVAVAPSALHRVADLGGVEAVTPRRAPIVAASTCPRGVAVSEGVEQLNVDGVPSEFDGSGVTVGVLSDSYDKATEAADGSGPVATHAEEDVETGDLPGTAGAGNTCTGETTPVDVLEDIPAGEAKDEGRGMLQIVHDVAPRASLAFATAFTGEEGFAENIERLASEGNADVIVDDVSYLEEPFFQDGPIAAAVAKVTAAGVTYLSAAGNNNLFDSEGHEIGSWEAPQFRDSGSCPPAVQGITEANGTHCMDFNPGAQIDKTYGMKVPPGVTLTVSLQWDEPWGGVDTDLDAFLLNDEGGLIAVAGEDNVKSQVPAELLQWANGTSTQKTVQLVINRFSGDNPRLKFALLGNGAGPSGVEYPTSAGGDVVGPTVFGHAGAASAIGIGAVPFLTKEEPEKYSSRGPVTHYFGPVAGKTAAAELLSPEVIAKPDIAATDCGATTFFAELMGSIWRFCGTSAAAPHAAGVAALMQDAEPSAEPEEIRSALLDSAVPVGAFGACAVGAGLVEAVDAVEEVQPPVTPAGPLDCEPPESPGSGENARASGDWGSEEPPASGGGGSPTPSAPTPTPPPQASLTAFFAKHPRRVVRTSGRTASVRFRFGANEPGVTFLCRVDGEALHPCAKSFTRRLRLGSHTVRLTARDSAGNTDPTSAVYRFRVKRIG